MKYRIPPPIPNTPDSGNTRTPTPNWCSFAALPSGGSAAAAAADACGGVWGGVICCADPVAVPIPASNKTTSNARFTRPPHTSLRRKRGRDQQEVHNVNRSGLMAVGENALERGMALAGGCLPRVCEAFEQREIAAQTLPERFVIHGWIPEARLEVPQPRNVHDARGLAGVV